MSMLLKFFIIFFLSGSCMFLKINSSSLSIICSAFLKTEIPFLVIMIRCFRLFSLSSFLERYPMETSVEICLLTVASVRCENEAIDAWETGVSTLHIKPMRIINCEKEIVFSFKRACSRCFCTMV